MFATLREVLSLSLLFWEITGYVCTFVVILGCIGEYISDFTNIPKSEPQKHKLSKLSLIILTAGIAGELLTAVRTSQISGMVISGLEGSVRNARGAASDAAADAIRAEKAATGAESKADSVGVKADKAETKVTAVGRQAAELQKDLMSQERRGTTLMNPAIRKRFKAHLASFKGQVFVTLPSECVSLRGPV